MKKMLRFRTKIVKISFINTQKAYEKCLLLSQLDYVWLMIVFITLPDKIAKRTKKKERIAYAKISYNQALRVRRTIPTPNTLPKLKHPNSSLSITFRSLWFRVNFFFVFFVSISFSLYPFECVYQRGRERVANVWVSFRAIFLRSPLSFRLFLFRFDIYSYFMTS